LLPFSPEPSVFSSAVQNIKVGIYKTIILPVVLYGCVSCVSDIKEHRLRLFENRVLRSIFGQKRDEMTGGLRKPHNEELKNLYFSSSIIRMIKSRMMSMKHEWCEEDCM
jgi:hypothetical protein